MDGIIVINKEKDYTSHDVVAIVKKIFNEKVGHTGTLDPIATGVLPLLVGKGTKLSKYLIEHDKTYIAKIKLGEKKDTGDSEGKTIKTLEVKEKLDEINVQKVLENFLGKQKQIPPIYSAIKVNGKKLYEYAREGKEVEIPEREIEIYNISLVNIDKENNEIEFEVSCSKGTYIRVLCENIAEKLGTCGYMKSLIRTRVDNFYIEDAITFEELEKNGVEKYLISMEKIFKEFPKINLNERKTELFLNGVLLTFKLENGIYNVYSEEKYLGTGIVKNELLKRDVII